MHKLTAAAIALFTIASVAPDQAFAQGAGGRLSQGERQQQISKVIEDLNGPDPAVRIAAFEAATASRDRVLVRVAIEQGLNSKDQVIRESALLQAMSSLRSIYLQIAPTNAPNSDGAAFAAQTIGGGFQLLIFGFNAATGEFSAAMPSSPSQTDNGVIRYSSGAAGLSGDRLSFQFPLNERWLAGAGSNTNTRLKRCSGNLKLGASGPVMTGRMTCQALSVNYEFAVTANVLN